MSASDPDSTIYLNDTDNQIKKKIGKAFSGGQDTKELHEKLGGRTNVDVPFQYLNFFLEDDDRLEEIKRSYETGKMQSGEMKAIATKELQTYVSAFRERRKIVTPEVRDQYLTPRQLEFRGMPQAKDRKVGLEAKKKQLSSELARIEADLLQIEREKSLPK